MQPKREPSDESTALVELNTGAYRVGDLVWMEFTIFNYGQAEAEAIDQWIAGPIEHVIAKSRAEGIALEYLGRQGQMVETSLDGCLVFAHSGDYQRIEKDA